MWRIDIEFITSVTRKYFDKALVLCTGFKCIVIVSYCVYGCANNTLVVGALNIERK